MEGPLSKWTNVMQGWQFRWFVLDEAGGVLSYYTSKDKMNRGQRRGALRLRGAIIAFENEDDSAFTVSTDQKTFHFQARDSDERDRWLRALELVIHMHSGYYKPTALKRVSASSANANAGMKELNKQISHADQYLQILIDQVAELETQAAAGEDNKQKYAPIIESSKAMLDTVKHAIVIMQMAKNQIQPSVGQVDVADIKTQPLDAHVTQLKITDDIVAPSMLPAGAARRLRLNSMTAGLPGAGVGEPPVSFSSDEEDEEFEDAMDTMLQEHIQQEQQQLHSEDQFEDTEDAAMKANRGGGSTTTTSSEQASESTVQRLAADELGAEPDWADANTDFDAIALQSDEQQRWPFDLGDVGSQHGSVIMALLSQVSIGMDLTKIPLPMFILEKRSLLEMYSDFYSHPDLFTSIADQPTAELRFVAATKWYLSSFHAGRNTDVAKKPFNPILGETFRCAWQWQTSSDSDDQENLPPANSISSSDNRSETKAEHTPYPGAPSNALTFIAEQVSHHPPISAFYCEHAGKRIQCQASIWTKSKFLGLSIGVHMVGQGCISLLQHNEDYIATFPSAFGRSILTTPWMEMGGNVEIKCPKTGYRGTITFLTKPFMGGKPHQILAELYRPDNSKFMVIKGTWTGKMTQKLTTESSTSTFLDVSELPITKKQCRPIKDQSDTESRRQWRHVAAALSHNDIHKASQAKHFLEQRQRLERKHRDKLGLKWKPYNFYEDGQNWLYRWPLSSRKA